MLDQDLLSINQSYAELIVGLSTELSTCYYFLKKITALFIKYRIKIKIIGCVNTKIMEQFKDIVYK